MADYDDGDNDSKYDSDDEEEDFRTVEVAAVEFPFNALQALLGARLDEEDLALANALLQALLKENGGNEIAADSRFTSHRKGFSMDADTVREVQKIHQAEEAVASVTGDVTGKFSSEGAVYRHALKMMGHDSAKVSALGGSASAAKAMFDITRRGGRSPALGMDAASFQKYNARFPDAQRLKR